MTAQEIDDRRAPAAYFEVGDETKVFRAAWERGLPVMLKGPTGCGKTRLVEYMADTLNVPLHTVSCHEDMTASDLLGRFLLVGGETRWVDGPLTRAAREGGICYLDEVVEARQDAIVAIHSLADHRRELTLERLGGERITAAPRFQLVVSYNPGYQSVLKDLKPSTRQRMVAIELTYPSPEVEARIVEIESGLGGAGLDALLRLARAIRGLSAADLKETCSTRTLISAASLMRAGLSFRAAATAAITAPLSDDVEVSDGLDALIATYDR